jgi:hypothetical protein
LKKAAEKRSLISILSTDPKKHKLPEAECLGPGTRKNPA